MTGPKERKGTARRPPQDWRKSPFSGAERVFSLTVSVGAGIAVLAATRSLGWGLLTFLLVGVPVNAYLLWRRNKKGKTQEGDGTR